MKLIQRSRARLTCLLLLLVMLPSLSWGHARFDSATPAPDSSSTKTVERIVLHFNEPVRPVSIGLINSTGEDLAAGLQPLSIDADIVLELATPPPPGSYLVSYRVLSSDAHPIAASFGFTIEGELANQDNNAISPGNDNGATKAVAATGVATTESEWARYVIIMRAIFMLGLLLSAGSALFIVATPSAHTLHPVMRRNVVWLSSFTTLAALLYLQVSGADMLGSAALPDVQALQIAFDSSLGTSLSIAVLGLLILIGGRAKTSTILLLGVALLAASRAFTGHPASREPSWLLMPAMTIHVACAAFWYGSLRPLYVSLKKLPTAQAAAVVREFSVAAIVAVISLATLGVLTALVHLSTPSALLGTWYGQLLIMKSTWFSVLLALAAWHKLRLSPRIEAGDARAVRTLRFSIIAEAIIMTLVVLISVNLASTAPEAPPRSESAVAEADSWEVVSRSGNYWMRADRAGGNESPFNVSFADANHAPVKPLELKVSVSVPAAGVEALPAVVTANSDGTFAVTPTLAIAGQWQLHADALITDFDQESFVIELRQN